MSEKLSWQSRSSYHGLPCTQQGWRLCHCCPAIVSPQYPALLPERPTPAPARGCPATHRFCKLSQARELNASTHPGQHFYGGWCAWGGAVREGGTWTSAAKLQTPPCMPRGCFADAVASAAPTCSLSPSNYPTQTLTIPLLISKLALLPSHPLSILEGRECDTG